MSNDDRALADRDVGMAARSFALLDRVIRAGVWSRRGSAVPMSAGVPRWLALAVVFLAAFLLYAPSFRASFAVLDFNHLDAIRANDAPNDGA